MIELPRKAKGDRPVYLQDRTTDNILSMLLALAGEMVVLRERLDSAERLLGDDFSARIDTYRPDAATMEAREAWRAQYLDLIMRPIQQEREALEEGSTGYDSAIAAVSVAD